MNTGISTKTLHYYYMLYYYETNSISLWCWTKWAKAERMTVWERRGRIGFHCRLLSIYIPLIFTIDVKTMTFCHTTYTYTHLLTSWLHSDTRFSLCVCQVFNLTTCQAKYPFVKWERERSPCEHTLFSCSFVLMKVQRKNLYILLYAI